jgi:hypothetical protein
MLPAFDVKFWTAPTDAQKRGACVRAINGNERWNGNQFRILIGLLPRTTLEEPRWEMLNLGSS